MRSWQRRCGAGQIVEFGAIAVYNEYCGQTAESMFRRQRNRGYLSGGSRSGSAELKPAYRKTQNKRPETNCKQMVSGLLFCEDSKRNTEGFLPLAGLKYDKKITIWT